MDDYIFTNQDSGKQISERIWQDSIADLLVEARLADWREDANSQVKKVVIHSGKNITWYSFRHTYITMRLSAGVPLPTVAANTDTSMKYIQEHYFHYRADESTEILGKGRKIKPAEESSDLIRIEKVHACKFNYLGFKTNNYMSFQVELNI